MTTKKTAKELEAALQNKAAINKTELAFHLGVDHGNVPGVASAKGLETFAGAYSWTRILRSIHNTEGALLNGYLAELKEQHPNSPTLSGIDDLQAELRRPLMDLNAMAAMLGKKPPALRAAIREGRLTLPFATIQLGERQRRYRPLDVTLFVLEEISLSLPKPIWPADKEPRQGPAGSAPKPVASKAVGSCTIDDAGKPADPVKKAVFGYKKR